MEFFSTNFGQFLTQSVFHSLVIAIVIESLISIWKIRNPITKIRFRLLPLVLPALYLPLFYLIYPSRSATHFHEEISLMDLTQWLGLNAGIAVWHIFVIVLIVTATLFITREAVPGIQHLLSKKFYFPKVEKGDFPKLDLALENLSKSTSHKLPLIYKSSRNVPVLYSLGHKSLVLSPSTIDILDVEELEAVIAHEIAHLVWQGTWTNRVTLFLRFLMFYNPVALVIFRYIISENEKVCDDLAIKLTNRRLALASGLLKVFSNSRIEQPASTVNNAKSSRNWLTPRVKTLQYRAYRELVKERVERMVHPKKDNDIQYQNLRLLLTGAMLAVLLFFVV